MGRKILPVRFECRLMDVARMADVQKNTPRVKNPDTLGKAFKRRLLAVRGLSVRRVGSCTEKGRAQPFGTVIAVLLQGMECLHGQIRSR